MAKTKDTSNAIIPVSRITIKKKAHVGRQYPGVDCSKMKRFNAICYKSLFKPQRVRIESVFYLDTNQIQCVGGNMEKQVGGECLVSNPNANYDACVDNDNHIFHTPSSRHDIENQQELDPCDKVRKNYGNVSTCSKFVEFWVPVELSNVQLEQYCATLISNSMLLCCGLKDTVGGALHDIFISNRKCCNHPYVVDRTLQSKILKDQEPTMLQLDADIRASGKLQFLDLVLPEVKKRSLRVLILFQSTTVTTKGIPTVGDMLIDFVHQRFGEDSYEYLLTGLKSSKKQTALNKFNKDVTIPFFLLEHRACNASVKLTSVDIIFIFDSDLTPANDLKSIQKISVDSHSDQIKIFRLYSSSTLEEKILKLADTNNESRLHNVRSRYDTLLKWGAYNLFDRLTEFHQGSVFSISYEESFLMDVVEEFLYLINNKSERNDKSKSIITRVQNFGIYSKNETETQLPAGEQPHIFWKKLLEGRFPKWKFVPFSTPQQRKRTRYLDGATNGTSTEDGGGVKIRRTTVNPVIETVTGNLNLNSPQSSSIDEFQSCLKKRQTRDRDDKGRFSIQKVNDNQNSFSPNLTTVNNDKSLHDLLKATMSDLFNVLELSDDVKITVEKFLEFVLENYRPSNEDTTELQALMISMCWVGCALENINIDRLESFEIAKKHLKFICDVEEAYSVYGKLKPVKKAFVQTHRPTLKRCVSSTQRTKLDTEKSKRTFACKNDEINKFLRVWEEQKVRLENNYKMDQTRIQSIHRKQSVTSEKLTKLEESFVRKMEKHEKMREVYLKEKASQVTANSGHSLHGPKDNSPEVGPSHDEPSIPNVVEDDVSSGGPIGQVSTQHHHHDDIIKHDDAAREVDDYVAVEHHNEAREDRIDLCSFSSNPPCTDSSPQVIIIRDTENESHQVQSFPYGEKLGKEANSLCVIDDVEHRPSLDACQLGQMIMEAEEERLRLAMDDVVKMHEETKKRLKIDCEEEIEKMCAEINKKYEAKCQEEEAAFDIKKKEINAYLERGVRNKLLASAFRSKTH